MRVAIVEYGGNLALVFEKIVSEKIANVEFEKKRALDVFDVLAFARQMAEQDQIVIIAFIDPEDQGMKTAFYEGLATLEADTGKNIFKCLYSEDGAAEVEKLAEAFITYIYQPEKLEKAAAEEGEGGGGGGPFGEEPPGPPELPEGLLP